MKKFSVSSLIFTLALCLCLLCACQPKSGSDLRTAVAEIGTLESSVTDTGTVAYSDSFSVIPVVNGKILSCSFEEGDTVTAGQILYVIDSVALEDQITQAELSLRSAQLAYDQALDACDDLTVRSSASGSVTAVYVHEGDYVGAGTPIADVVDSANLTLTVPFAPADAAAMAPGDPAVISFSAFSGTVNGQVKRVYDASTALSGGREGVYVEFSFRNPGALTAGDLATAAVGRADCMAAGAVDCATRQSIFATQAGQVLSLPISAGVTVSQDEVVMTIDNPSLTNGRDNAALALETARVSLDQLVSKRGDYTVSAPVSGTVISRNFRAGDYAAAATPMAVLAGDGALEVQVPIDEIYIDQIRPDLKAEISFVSDSGERRSYSARVQRINDTGITAGGVTDYVVELELERADGLKAGMNVTVEIVTLSKENCLKVPASAVSDGSVRLLRDGKSETVPVTAGVSGGGCIEILSGLSAGDTVILP